MRGLRNFIVGKIKNASIGALSGKVGNLVGSSWKGTDYYRIHNEHIANPRTPKQVAQRERFKSMSFLSHKLMTAVIKPIWNKTAVKMTGANYFMQKNMPTIRPDAEIDLSKLIMSDGRLDAPFSVDFTKDLSDDVSYILDWIDNADLYDFDENDLLNIVIFNEADISVTPFLQLHVATRKDMIYQFTPKGEIGNKLHIFAYFSKADGSNFTESKHFELTIDK